MKKLTKTQVTIAEGPYQPPLPGMSNGPQFTVVSKPQTLGGKRKSNAMPEEYYKSPAQQNFETSLKPKKK